MSLSAKYRKSLENKWFLRFKTLHPDGDAYDGIIVHACRSFVVLNEISDFEFDGFVVLPKRVITGYRDSKFESTYNDIIQKNGTLNKLRPPVWLSSCLTLKDLLETLKRRKIWPGIEVVVDDGKDSVFFLGPIAEVTVEGIVLYSYDATGHWEGTFKLDFDDIFKVQFADKYSRYFNKYIKQTAGPPTA